MALQHVRSMLWRGEDLGAGGGNARELTMPLTVAAGARPTLITQAFAGSYTVPFFGASVTLVVTGKNRLLVNRSSRFFITVSGVAASANGSTGAAVSFCIAPLQMFFVPQNLIGPATISMNNSWPLPQPISGSPGASVPLATSLNGLTFDWVVEP